MICASRKPSSNYDFTTLTSMALIPETVTITLTVEMYNDRSEYEDYHEIKECLVNSLNDEGEDALRITLNHFVGTVFGDHNEVSRKECAELAPKLWALSSFDPSETFLNIEGVSWRHTTTNTLAEDECVGIEHEGYVMFDIEVPAGIDKRTFLTEFNALFKWYSNDYVVWGWLDTGYIIDSSHISLA